MADHNDFPRVELRGNQLDLENLAAVLHDGDHRVSSEEGLYWLRSTDFAGLAGDPERARAKASALLPLINAVAKAHIYGFEPIELGQCVDWVRSDGRLRRRLSDTVTLHVRSNHRITAPDQAATVDMQIKKWMTLARGDQDVADVLRLWGSRRMQDWKTLSNIKEKIEARVGSQMVHLGWATRSELSRFDQTANSPAVLGDAARHGVQRTDPPAAPMGIGQAQELVKRLIDGWIESLRTNI